MAIRINNLKVPLETSAEELKEKALAKIGRKPSDCLGFRIFRQSVDARKKQVSFVYGVELDLKDEKRVACDGSQVVRVEKRQQKAPVPGTAPLKERPVVVGMGPCGLFCALALARAGYRPLVLERGDDVDERTRKVELFWQSGRLDTETNVQFGEGGAGTFSDGKLTTRISDPHCAGILADFVRFGADERILYQAKPHIGTDVLKQVVKRMRKEIQALGGEVRFRCRVDDILAQNGAVYAVRTADGEEIPCGVLVLAIGHSARDTYQLLFDRGIALLQKPFSVGTRIEHPQKWLNEQMYGGFAGHPALGAADYQLSHREGDRACYTFCMCPGGVVVAAASEENSVVTNGMSESARDRANANSAVCVSVDGRDFGSSHSLAGVWFQRQLEQAAFRLGGSNYHAPAQTVRDFLEGTPTRAFAQVVPSYTGGVCGADLNKLFSGGVSGMLANGLRVFDRKIKGFADGGAVLTGAETRTSAPVRITRGDTLQSESLAGLYPAGEGAGYAGGIMSAAADGVKIAEQIIRTYRVPD